MNLIFTPRMIVALAALLASTLVAACGLRSTNPSTETLTIYQDAPKMKLLDLGEPGNSPGDVYHFFAPLHSSPGGPVIGEVFGSKTLVKLATDGNPNLEQRTTLLSFTFSDRQDQIIALGVADYSPTAGEFNPSQPRARAIRRDRKVYGRTWPIDQYAECRWLIYAGVHAAKVMPIKWGKQFP